MIIVNVCVGEAIDKLSILMVKEKNIKEESKLFFIKEEIKELKLSLDIIEDYSSFLEELIVINSNLWDCNETRKKKIIDKEFDQHYIELTINESLINDQRFIIKNKINIHYNSDLREQKSYAWIT